MQSISIQEQLGMNYTDYVIFLMEKHGIVRESYFLNEGCKTKNSRIVRTKDGLCIHHIAEFLYPKLSDARIAKHLPFEYQMPDKLIYANLLEHLLLHIKITEEFNNESGDTFPVGIGGVLFITRQINDYFGNLPKLPSGWELNMFNAIKGNYSDYIEALKYIRNSDNEWLKCVQVEALASGRNGELYDNIALNIEGE